MRSYRKVFLLLLLVGLAAGLQSGCSGGTGVVTYGSLSGTIRDSLSGDPIEGVTVNVEGASIKTDQYGRYRLDNLETGTKNMTVVKTGYYSISRTVYIWRNQVNEEDYALSTFIAQGQMRIVLTWGGKPTDLDSHLLVPISDSNPNFGDDVGGDNLGYINDYPYATLSWDETDGYPEAITIYHRFLQNYVYFVYNYSAEEDLNYSEARVEVYNSNGLFRRYTVPSSGSGDYWNVFKISASGQLIDVNELLDYVSLAATNQVVDIKEKKLNRSRR